LLETEEDFYATLYAIRRIRFDRVSLFPYYDGHDTIAFGMDNKVSDDEIKRRIEIAMEFLSKENILCECEELRPI